MSPDVVYGRGEQVSAAARERRRCCGRRCRVRPLLRPAEILEAHAGAVATNIGLRQANQLPAGFNLDPAPTSRSNRDMPRISAPTGPHAISTQRLIPETVRRFVPQGPTARTRQLQLRRSAASPRTTRWPFASSKLDVRLFPRAPAVRKSGGQLLAVGRPSSTTARGTLPDDFYGLSALSSIPPIGW